MEKTEKALRVCGISQKYRFQGPRYRELGDASGQEFREEHLVPWLESLGGGSATIDFEGTRVFSPSFLEESFGGAIRADGRNRERLGGVSFVGIDRIWHDKLQRYIKEA